MSRVKSKNTKIEMIVRRYLHAKGYRYRLKTRLPGNPDIVFTAKKKVIFINGCFWHGHENCKDFRLPKTNTEIWGKKISDNVSRDKKNILMLQKMGWDVITIWECEIERNNSTLDQLKNRLNSI